MRLVIPARFEDKTSKEITYTHMVPFGLREVALGRIQGTDISLTQRDLLSANIQFYFYFFGATAPSGPRPPHSRGFWITHNDAPHSVGLL